MIVNKGLIIAAILTCFVSNEVSSTSAPKDVVKISVIQCQSCDSSSYQLFTIGARSAKAGNIRMSVPSSSYFFIIQVHSYLESVRLSYDAEHTAQNSVHGTNIGLNQLTRGDKANHTFYLFNNFTEPRVVLVAVTSYSKAAPLPGGCNMEFNTETAPYQSVIYDEALIAVSVQSASVAQSQRVCEVQGNITLDFYQIFIDPAELPSNASYKAITQMLTVEAIRANGHQVIRPINSPVLRRYFNNYRGFGVVFAVIASFGNASAAYVPAFTQGCDMHNGTKSCFTQETYPEWMTMDVASAISLFLLLTPSTAHVVPVFHIGYYAANAALILSGLPVWAFIYYIIGSVTILALVLGGLSMYCSFDNILLRFYAGHILTAVIYFGTATGDFILCQTVGYFWILYAVFFLMAMIPTLDKPAKYIAVSFHTVLMLDSLIGNDRMMYININAVRRASVPQFYMASLYAPDTSLAVIICICIIMISCARCACCRNQTGRVLSETTPLLHR